MAAGAQCTTRNLRENFGWTGVMMDGGYKNESIGLFQEYITADNIAQLFQKHSVPMVFDHLTVDIDLNTYHVLARILAAGYRPRSLAVEINRNFGPDLAYTTVYMPNHSWDRTCYFGASAAAVRNLAAYAGYYPVAIDMDGVNLFLVHNSTVGGKPIFKWREVVYNLPDQDRAWATLHYPCHINLWWKVRSDTCLIPTWLHHRAQGDFAKVHFVGPDPVFQWLTQEMLANDPTQAHCPKLALTRPF